MSRLKSATLWAMAGTAAGLAYLATKKTLHASQVNNDTVDFVDLNRYAGDWYDIAHLPQTFQRGTVGTMAHYALDDNGDLMVTNTAFEGDFDGKLRKATARGYVVDKKTNAKLKVSFFWPFKGDYWILELDPKYKWAVVGSDNKSDLWILSRTPEISNKLKEDLLTRIRARGYDIRKLIWEIQK